MLKIQGNQQRGTDTQKNTTFSGGNLCGEFVHSIQWYIPRSVIKYYPVITSSFSLPSKAEKVNFVGNWRCKKSVALQLNSKKKKKKCVDGPD